MFGVSIDWLRFVFETENLQHSLKSSFGHKDVCEHICRYVRGEQGALQRRRQISRHRIKDETCGKKDNYSDEHIES